MVLALKYVVVSLQRSGTFSTAKYLNWLGIPTIHWPTKHGGINLEDKVAGRESDRSHVTDALSPVLHEFEAVADVPCPVLYKELLIRYPHARFILVYRSAFDWVRSNRAHHLRFGTDLTPYERVVYWYYFDWRPMSLDELTDNQLIWMHAQHAADVIAFFQREASANLGVFDLYDRDVGPKIAKFLGVQTEIAFPHYNAGPELAYVPR